MHPAVPRETSQEPQPRSPRSEPARAHRGHHARDQSPSMGCLEPGVLWLPASFSLALLGLLLVACSDDPGGEPAGPVPVADSGGPVVADAGLDGGAELDSGGSDGGADAGPQPMQPVFLEPSAYEQWVTLSPELPFGVTQLRSAEGPVLGSRWGRHGGPLVTSGVYGGDEGPAVVQWDVTGDPTSPVVASATAFATASDLPDMFFYGADGMVDLPFGPVSLLSYSGSPAPFPGEALLYDETYGAVTSRAHVNGFYSGAGVEVAGDSFLIFSALSPLASSASSTSDNGLYAAQVCAGQLVSDAPCAPSWKLFSWTGASGPVVTDAHGNIFVAASLSDGPSSDAVFGLRSSQVAPGATVDAVSIAEVNTLGTFSVAATEPEGDAAGWVFGIGFDPSGGVYAASYLEESDALVAGGDRVEPAISAAEGVAGLSVFSDPEGDLWLAVTTGSDAVFLELRRN